MPTQVLSISRETQALTPRFPHWVDHVALSAGVAASYTVPSNVDNIRITYTAGVLYGRGDGGTAAAPGAGITDGTGSEMILQGDMFAIDKGAVLSLFNADACVVIVSCRGAFR